ncbi:hypothetical protein LDENG_00019390 [Lucifuga dentata]|nr:hypothetical protein LDENG_00019390 [Lucifuga dentata]
MSTDTNQRHQVICRNRMWTFPFLYFLWLHICQASGQGNSTQMYYFTLTVEEGAIKNITENLRDFTVANDTVKVGNLEMTTKCGSVQDGELCTCMLNYKWSDEVCESQRACCKTKKCRFPKESSEVCLSDNTVHIQGSVRLTGEMYHDCLAEKTTEIFKKCHDNLLKELKKVYSTLRGFNSLTITHFSLGSVIAHFEIDVVYCVSPEELIEKARLLNQTLKVQLSMETKGVVKMNMPPGPVCYNSKDKIITCISPEELKSQPEWHLTVLGKRLYITNGTESEVTSKPGNTTVTLKRLSEHWAGNFTCTYRQESDIYTINHQDTSMLDVALLPPDIYIISQPLFPRCKGGSAELVHVAVQCEIMASSESYVVTWHGQGNISEIKQAPFKMSGQGVIYEAGTIVGCNPAEKPATVTCTFTNRCKETRIATLKINVIYEKDKFCTAEDGWPDTKGNFTAVLKCKNSAGQRFRSCTADAKWEEEESACVNRDLNEIQKDTAIIDIGLGKLDDNAAGVLFRLEAATNDTRNINTYSNVDASVSILSSIAEKLHHVNYQSILNDFLQSSSNLLSDSLEDVWVKKTKNKSILSLGERYLSSVEQFIEKTNTRDALLKLLFKKPPAQQMKLH